MTIKEKSGSEKPLDKMTVKDLREVAKEIPEITGAHGMKKDELLAAIKQARGIEDEPAPAEKPAKPKKKPGKAAGKLSDMTRPELKMLIKDLKSKRLQAIEEKDRKMARIYKRRISRIKKRTRQAA